MSILAGRRVVITRAVEQAEQLATLLEQRGAVPVFVSLIEVVPDPAGIEQLVAALHRDHDWLIVTSPNGAERLVDVVRHDATGPQFLRPKVAAIGPTTAAVLQAAKIAVDLTPAVHSANGLLAELAAMTPEGSPPGAALVVQSAIAEPTLADGLRRLGWTVSTIAPYRTLPARVTAGQQLAALSADAVLFASGSAARAWAAVFGDSMPPISVAIGPQTAAAARQAGLKVTLVAADHSLSGMVLALERHLAGSD